MTKTLYTAEPEIKLEGRWQPASREEARRWAVYRVAYLPRKRGQQRPAPKRRLLATFFGPDAESAAFALVRHSQRLAKPRAPAKTRIIARSLTQEQWLRAQDERNWK